MVYIYFLGHSFSKPSDTESKANWRPGIVEEKAFLAVVSDIIIQFLKIFSLRWGMMCLHGWRLVKHEPVDCE
jgi:hypothetical protein